MRIIRVIPAERRVIPAQAGIQFAVLQNAVERRVIPAQAGIQFATNGDVLRW